jgi:hypothetical protein
MTRMSQAEAEGIADEMMKTTGSVMSFEVHPSDEKLQREGPGSTISEDAWEDLKDNIGRWIGSRILRRHKRTGKMAERISVAVAVKLEGEDPEAGEPVTYSFDGSNRR